MMQEYEKAHLELVRSMAPECMVLLKSDGGFPLEAPGRIALYGSGARRTIKGGTGSGDVNVRHYTTVEEGLENAGFTITTKSWLDGYDAIWSEAHQTFNAGLKARIAAEGMSAIMFAVGAVMPEPEYELPLSGEGDTAVYVLARVSGEGADRQPIPGDFELTRTEIRDILRLQKQYKRFLLVLNVGGVVDLSPVADAVSNILILSQPGMTVGDSFADVLLGKAYPSGKLASTWAAWEDYCHVGDFGGQDDTRYTEGVYVGYRYFDSVDKAPLFPFGYGLGYTTFAIKAENVRLDGAAVTVTAQITNTGNHSGKEVAQLYVSVPAGKLDQPYQTLAAFAKTDELRSGESQRISLTFAMEGLASFDEETACAILEHGDYILRLGSSSRDTAVCGVVHLTGSVVVQELSHSGGKPDFTDWRPDQRRKMDVPDGVPAIELNAANVRKLQPAAPEVDPKAMELAKQLTDEELAYLCVGGFQDEGSGSFIGNAAMQVAGAAGETTGRFADKGISPLVMADGPAGLRLSRQYGVDENGVYSLDAGAFEVLKELLPEAMVAALAGPQVQRNGTIHEQNCTAIPIGTALAQSWSETLCEACGDLVGDEMERFGVHIWLAPALNIHRLPLCGRNFEYYSEDPLVSGKLAAAITRGTQKHTGRTVTIKHFACNNQETNRVHSNTQVSQRALRDIYLRGFRIAVEEGRPMTVMSSYNLLNGEHTSQREDLLETILRREWGYDGIVMSDWVTPGFASSGNKHPSACAHGSIRAGNDIMMPGGRVDHQNLLDALHGEKEDYTLTREKLELCAARMISLVWRLRVGARHS